MEVHNYGLCTYTLGEGNGTPLQYLAWKIPWMEEPGGLQSMGSLRVGHDWVTSLSCLGKGNGNPLQCSCLENPRDGGAWWAAVYGVTQSWTWLKRLSSSSSSYALFFFFFFRVFCLSVQSLSRAQLFAPQWIAAHQASLSITNSRSSLKLMPIESVMPSSHLILHRPLFLLLPILPSIRVFSNQSTLRMRWPKYWSFSFSISPSNEHPGLISFRMD